MDTFKLFQSIRKDKRQFAVIGLGRFGRAVCASLHKMGYEVVGTDVDEKRVAQALADRIVTHAIQLDSTETNALKEAGILEFDTVIIAIGNYLQESIITTLNVKEGGVPHIVAKASSEVHCKLLEKVGATQVIFPEHEAGCSLAKHLTTPQIIEQFALDADNSIVEINVPEQFIGKTLTELELRQRYTVSVLAIRQDKGNLFQLNPDPNKPLEQGTILVILGSNQNLQKLPV